MKSISIKAKLIAAFSLLIVMLGAVGLVSLRGTNNVAASADYIGLISLPSVRLAGDMNIQTSAYRLAMLRHIMYDDPAEKRRVDELLPRLVEAANNAALGYEPLIETPEEDAIFRRFEQNWQGFLREAEVVLDHSRRNDLVAARDHNREKALPFGRGLDEALAELVAFNDRNSAATVASGASTQETTTTLVIVALLVATVLGIAMAAFIVRGVSRGIASVVAPMRRLADGDLAVEIPARGEKTEIGSIADAVQVFKDALIAKKAADEAAAVENAAKMRRAETLDHLTKKFEAQVASLTQGLTSAATEMEATAQSMSSIAAQTNSQSVTVASAAEQTSANVQTVAAATEELVASIQEITHRVSHSSKVAAKAQDEAKRTDETVRALAERADRIGNVVSLINDIAAQTNLLALNATIEAARAGAAGRGFAVVAAEVKELAGQTSKATGEIAEQIGQVQEATRHFVTAIQEISATITEMASISTTVAAAMEEQGAATKEIARNVQEAARGTEQVTENIVEVKRGATDTGSAASQVLGAAKELAQNSSRLGDEVTSFLSGVKAA
ncbi:methyl-accepting chemotaxis protein [Salinarimonas ramus]|uniref:Methyl-accepting chemotaxis protein n=1 Tax=Salinarimonas ramus TaxID=690164 RepID=A0A917V365_9HYPH|nr:methyl-accepting chemotaxis protein [Salinarimonas ramus]GGK28435.1 methyl-accepting chemotaxis protein [Salinarimonas ramus]